MTTTRENQALIAKDITISAMDRLHLETYASKEQDNEAFRKEVCKLYEDVFNTVKRLTED